MRRRELLRRLPLAAAPVLVPWPLVAAGEEGGGVTVFRHGVASADPTAGGVVLWTRVSGAAGEAVTVRWTVASDPELADVVAAGDAQARAEHDWTVHVDVDGLRPGTTWWYAFESGGERSPVGRTRTAAPAGSGEELRLGVVSCASYAAGRFTVYRRLAEHDLDLVVHLGDYVYDDDGGQTARQHEPPGPPLSMADYRSRHAQYRADPDLQALHQRFPVAAVWDDHEVAGNAWEGGAPGHDADRHGSWVERRAAALRAFREWVPLRSPDPEDPERIWRSLPLGSAAELLLIDTRHDGRHRQVTRDHPDPAGALDDPDRRIMSEEQHRWLAERLEASPAAWRIIANQVVLSPLRIAVPAALAGVGRRLGLVVDGAVMNPDQWDGYPAARRRLLDVVGADAVGPVAVLTGDLHSSWALDVPAGGDPSGTPVAVELVVPSVTSASFAAIVGPDSDVVASGLASVAEDQLPHLRWAELSSHGYLVLSITPERIQGDWWHVAAIDGSSEDEALAASWTAAAGDPRLRPAPAALGPRPRPTPPPPPPAADPSGDDAGGPAGGRLGILGAAVAVAGGALLVLRRRRNNPDRGT